MFRKSKNESQLDAFGNISSMLDSQAYKLYNDQGYWHNQFFERIVCRIDENIFSVLYHSKTGAPNSSIRILVGMMILKEAFGWSDSQLFEHCHFNMLVRRSLGLFNMNDPLPVNSTYYLLRKNLHEHQKETGEDLMGEVFAQITSGQIKDFEVNGRSIRMDSKLIGSNIALFSRYEIIHQTMFLFYKSLKATGELSRLSAGDLEQLTNLVKEEAQKTVYRSTRDEIKSRLQPIGILIYKMLQLFGDLPTESFRLLQRVFNEQYKVSEDQKVDLRPKEEITSSSVQSPHDPDSAYRNKGDQKVKGYSVNLTETCSDNDLHLITSVIVEKANTPDTAFVEQAIAETASVTGQKIEKLYADGAYQTPANDQACEGIDVVLTGIQGAESKYELNMTADGLYVTDRQTAEVQKAVLVKKHKNSNGKGDRYRIKTADGFYYFDQKAIRAAGIRKKMKERPLHESQRRNNVEASIFQLGVPLKNGKSKYRGLIKQIMWTLCRCLWINLVRILNFTKQICQRTPGSAKKSALLTIFILLLTIWRHMKSKIRTYGYRLNITLYFKPFLSISQSF
jgi:hypothetical protein